MSSFGLVEDVRAWQKVRHVRDVHVLSIESGSTVQEIGVNVIEEMQLHLPTLNKE